MINRNIIEAKFIRSSFKGKNTSLWVDLSPALQEVVSSEVSFNESEEPIIVYIVDGHFKWILTTHGLFLNDQVFGLDQLEKVSLPEVYSTEEMKQEATSINLLIAGSDLRLSVEKRMWPLIYNVFKLLLAHGKL
jgi:hypothetical protein